MYSELTLFTEKGYDGVGVDLIAEKAGLKGPLLYKHFIGKEEILDTLISKVENYYETNFASKLHPGQIPASMDELINISLNRIEFTLHDEMIRKTRRTLTMEQFRNQRIAKFATRYNLVNIQGMYQNIFQGMMETGIIRHDDPAMLAMSFVAPITLNDTGNPYMPLGDIPDSRHFKAYKIASRAYPSCNDDLRSWWDCIVGIV